MIVMVPIAAYKDHGRVPTPAATILGPLDQLLDFDLGQISRLLLTSSKRRWQQGVDLILGKC
jgi:hypothetical protein